MYPQQSRGSTKPSNSVTSTVKYELKDDPFLVPFKFKRELPINKNFFELQETEPKNYQQKEDNVEMTEMTLLDPLQMSIATIKFLLLEKIISYTSLFSIALSIYQVYFVEEEELLENMTYFHTAITLLLVICISFSARFHYENNKSRRISHKYLILQTIIKTIILLLSPNPFFGENSKFFHLALLGRLFFPLTLYIRSTLYYSPRAARIINLYGIKPEMTFEFAWKVLFNSMDIIEVVFIYITVVLIFSHGLYLAAENTPFIDCFEIVIVTLPTVGFGDYRVDDVVPRIIIILILLTGVALNAFVTLILLKKFEMTTNENNSYILMEKLNMIEQIEELSSEFIIRKFQRKSLKSEVAEKEKDEDFKEKYKDCKSRYRKMNTQDSAYQFSSFKDSLLNLKIKIYQVNNMINVLLARLINRRRDKKSYFKFMKRGN
jgi:hypothetical protein